MEYTRWLGFLNNAEYSPFHYGYTSEMPPLSVGKGVRYVPVKGGFETEGVDGFILGNREMLCAIGCPAVIAESVFAYYKPEEASSLGIDTAICGENIDLHNYPSRISILVGPNKKHYHLRMLFAEYSFMDFIITYCTGNGSADKRVIMPLFTMPNRFLYRIKNSRITVSVFYNEDITVKIISGIHKSTDNGDLPVLYQNITVHPNNGREIGDISVFILLGNDAGDKIIHRAADGIEIFGINGKEKGVGWKIIPERYEEVEIYPSEIEDHTELKEINKDLSRLLMEGGDRNELTDETGFGYIFIKLPTENINDGIAFTQYYSVLFDSELPFGDTLSLMEEKGYIISEDKNYRINGYRFIEDTLSGWKKWCKEVEISVSDPIIDGLIDSLLTQLECIEGKTAFHIGTLYYDHDSAYWRDNFWIQYAMLKAGRINAAAKDTEFFYNAWKNDGFKNSYTISTKKGETVNAREHRIEITMYSALMVKNLYNILRDKRIIEKYYPMIKDAVDNSIYSENGLLILLSDETWIWPAFVNEHDYYLDNSIIALAGYRAAMDAASVIGAREDYDRWKRMFSDVLRGIKNHLIDTDNYRFACGIDNNGIKDTTLMTTPLSRPLLLGVTDILDKITIEKLGITARHTIYNALALIADIMLPDGVIRSHTRTTAIEGNTPGHYLHACAELDVPFLNDVFNTVLRFVNCTGSVNEIHDMYNKKWGTEKQRTWDSASLLEGILHYLFGINVYPDYFEINPHLPDRVHSASISRYPLGDSEIYITSHSHGGLPERSLYISRKTADNRFGEELRVISTTLPGKIRISRTYDGRGLPADLRIYMPFIYTHTTDENIPSAFYRKEDDKTFIGIYPIAFAVMPTGNYTVSFGTDIRIKVGTGKNHMLINIECGREDTFILADVNVIRKIFLSEIGPDGIKLSSIKECKPIKNRYTLSVRFVRE